MKRPILLPYEFYIALRYLKSKRRTSFISTITYISFFGIVLGVAVLAITMSVMNGFEHEVKSRFIAADAHLRLRAYGDKPFVFDNKIENLLKSDSLIMGYSPYIEQYGLIKGDYTEGAYIKGVSAETIGDVALIKDQIVKGFFDLENEIEKLPGIVLGKNLADKLAAIPGEKIRIISSAITSTFAQPPVKTFRVTGIFESGLAEIDANVCYIDINEAAKLYRIPGKIHGLYLKLHDIDDTDYVQKTLNDKLQYPNNVYSWKDLHRNLYEWMKIEKLMMGTILSLIIIVAAFNILSSLIMVVMEKKKEIGILMAMGASKNSISKIFIFQGFIIGITGTFCGVLLGILLCYLQMKFELVALPSDVYFLNAMPIKMETTDFVLVSLSSIVLVLLSTIYPARKAGNFPPAEIIRNE